MTQSVCSFFIKNTQYTWNVQLYSNGYSWNTRHCLFKKTVPIFISQCAEMCLDWIHLLEELDGPYSILLLSKPAHWHLKQNWISLLDFLLSQEKENFWLPLWETGRFVLSAAREWRLHTIQNWDSSSCCRYRGMCKAQNSKA